MKTVKRNVLIINPDADEGSDTELHEDSHDDVSDNTTDKEGKLCLLNLIM